MVAATGSGQLRLGIDNLESSGFAELANKNVAVVVNQTSVDRQGRHLVDLLLERKDELHLKVIFTPEHGLRGTVGAGVQIDDDMLDGSPVKIVSLYGSKRTPSAEDLSGLDLIVYDLQDVGSRYYTYISTLTNILKAAAVHQIPVMVLDRPNPLGGEIVRGPKVVPGFESFVGMHPVPIRYGLTSAELAVMINDQGWLGPGMTADLKLIPLSNWQREMLWPQTGLRWVATSPNIPDFETALIYNGMCLLEGTNISEGRGTAKPFLTFGAPWIDSEELADDLAALQLPGVDFTAVEFVPESIPEKARWPKYQDVACSGFRIRIKDFASCDPLLTAISILQVVRKNYPDKFEFIDTNYIDKLYGSDSLRKMILQGKSARSIVSGWETDESSFKQLREKYLLYGDSQ
ncbi:MAG: DUF1343 domain-containing protein [FCB group bacterium]|nr:DUF1343 domain-containing protein [FCB group bacterium]